MGEQMIVINRNADKNQAELEGMQTDLDAVCHCFLVKGAQREALPVIQTPPVFSVVNQ